MIGRREVIKFGAGGAIGTALTPLPWKLLDDTSIWSQNWSWIPPVPRGEVKTKESRCTLCPAGCAVRARCVGGTPVGLGPAEAGGALCPAGFAAHAAAYHPRRVRPLHDREQLLSKVAATVKQTNGHVAILDLGPRRAMAALLSQAAQASGKALYLRMPDREEASLDVLATMLGRKPGTLGIDLEHTRTLISFGAPVLEGWAVPGRVMNRWRSGEMKVVQIEARQSRTALAATRWIPSAPGRETSVTLEQIAPQAPAVAVGGGDAAWGWFDDSELRAIARLNIELGAIGSEGGVVAREPLPWGRTPPGDFTAVDDHSIGALLIDASRAFEATPWPLIRRKLTSDAIIVVFGYKEDAFTDHAIFVLPVSAPFESSEDVETPPLAAEPFYAAAPALIDSPLVRETPIDYVNAILGTSTTSMDDTIKQRTAAFAEMKTSKRLTLKPPALRAETQTVPPATTAPLTLVVHGPRGFAGDETSPMMTKLYQESGLYTTSAIARICPATALAFKLESGKPAVIQTPSGSAVRTVLFDPAVMPGVIEVASGPAPGDITEICTDGSQRNWRAVPVNVRRA